MDVIEIVDVTKTFGKHTAVDNLSLNVPENSIYGFIGPNGSGKTTTLRMIMNILYPDSGIIKVFGERRTGSASDRIGYLPEERGLYKNMKVRESLIFYAGLKKSDNLKKEADAWLERFDLQDWADRKVETLSKGMSQKLQFIVAILTAPELLILDEPFTGLDPVNLDVIREAVLEIRDKGTTIIFSTHDMNMAEKMCDFIFMICQGEKVLDGTLESIQAQYSNDTVRINAENGNSVIDSIDGIEQIRNFGKLQELRLKKGIDPQDIITQIMSRTRVKSFDVSKSSLHDIFVRIAGREALREEDA
ncbi:MAG: ATP-binding cassette domain-containing protein [candidate division Zixibacteria bacterium]|nr:ATP-binding cassette domain-containing protein [candidate division Zixibacteria bacterium]NIR66676.1 ATP-binding cassette domain-containing protein [candidate division Zixibacteria bacterium]NIS14809.1 ATP-binding cassette domain-containing protein [candidate division Zixibacteria bacterium]NIS48210.1 ATP-binding cassette domain-containing protein [candidate division Zixibacteria bacterium]NIT51354.1 ATP-binding cassette domain-containing protein [candidate division Zixibacteria bacterium]